MLWTPQKGKTRIITNGSAASTPPGTVIPANATTLLDGAVTEIISAAANDQDSWGMSVMIFWTSAGAALTQSSVDILIGGATDDLLIGQLLAGGATRVLPQMYFFPIHIPAGKRIAATLAHVTASYANARILITLYGGGVPPFRVGSKVDTLGTPVNNVRGVAITPGASGATTTTEIVASTPRDYFALYPGFQPSTDTTMTTAGLIMSIMAGAATEEEVGRYFFTTGSDESACGPLPPMPTFREIPAGTRLALKVGSATTIDAGYDGLIYGIA